MQEPNEQRIESAVQPFDPGRFVRKVDGRDYLEVKWRLVWLRDQHPDSEIETELISHQGGVALFRARITKVSANGTPIGKATGWAMRSQQDDGPDYLEKGETASIGRALAHLGYGTQFVTDDEGRIVDAPVQQVSRGAGRPPDNVRPINQGGNQGAAQGQYQQRQGGQQGGGNPNWREEPVTAGQVKFLWDLLGQAGYDAMQAEAFILREFGVQGGPEGLNKGMANDAIKGLKRELGLPD